MNEFDTPEEAQRYADLNNLAVWIHGTKYLVVPKEIYVPDIISKRQLCIQCVRDGIYQNVIDYIASLPTDNEIKIGFETATEFHRERDDVQQMFAFFQVDIDAFFIEAAKII